MTAMCKSRTTGAKIGQTSSATSKIYRKTPGFLRSKPDTLRKARRMQVLIRTLSAICRRMFIRQRISGKLGRRLSRRTPMFAVTRTLSKKILVNKDLLFVGTEMGLWISLDGGRLWAQYKGGDFPNVAVRDITIHPLDNDLVVATHGRGIWIIDDITPLRALTQETLSKRHRVSTSRTSRSKNSSGRRLGQRRRGLRRRQSDGRSRHYLLSEKTAHFRRFEN